VAHNQTDKQAMQQKQNKCQHPSPSKRTLSPERLKGLAGNQKHNAHENKASEPLAPSRQLPSSAPSQACWTFDGSCLSSNGSRACCADRLVSSCLNMPVGLSAKRNSSKMTLSAFLLPRSTAAEICHWEALALLQLTDDCSFFFFFFFFLGWRDINYTKQR